MTFRLYVLILFYQFGGREMAAGKGSALPSPTKGGGEGEGGSAKRENDCSAIFKPQDVVFGRNSRRENRHSIPKTEGKGEGVARNVTSIIEQLLEKE